MGERSRIVLGEDEFAEDQPQPANTSTSSFQQLPPIASPAEPTRVPTAPQPGTGNDLLTDPRIAPVIAGAASMAIAWALCELLNAGAWGDSWSGATGLAAGQGLYFGFVGMIFGSAMLSYDRFFAGAYEEALKRALMAAVPMFGLAFAAGFMAQVMYSAMLDPAGAFATSNIRVYFARIVGWSLFGLGVGAAGGLITGSMPRAVNGALGGAIGGALGGFLFQAVSEVFIAGSGAARGFGLMSIAILIAVFTRVIEQVRREAWLSVISGGMAGKEFIVYHQQTRVGASPECEIYLLKDPAVAKQHAWIDDIGGQRVLNAVDGNFVLVNGQPVSRHILQDGNHVQIGNSVIRYSERVPAPVSSSFHA